MLYFSIIVCGKVEFPLGERSAGLLRTSTSSPSGNFVPLVLVILVVAEILVFVMAFVLEKERFGMKTGSLWTGTGNFEIQDGKDVDILHRPGSESQCHGHARYDLTLI